MGEMIIKKTTGVGISIILKYCSKCKENKPLDEFYSSGGWYCKLCNKKYRLENADKIKECNKKYRLENADKIKECNKKYRLENADKIKEYFFKNSAKAKKYHKAYYLKNADKIKKTSKKRYFKNPNKFIKYQKTRYSKNPLKAKEYNSKRAIDMPDSYIKQHLLSSFKEAGLKPEDITPKMIELKRGQMLLRRAIAKGKRSKKNGTICARHQRNKTIRKTA